MIKLTHNFSRDLDGAMKGFPQKIALHFYGTGEGITNSFNHIPAVLIIKNPI